MSIQSTRSDRRTKVWRMGKDTSMHFLSTYRCMLCGDSLGDHISGLCDFLKYEYSLRGDDHIWDTFWEVIRASSMTVISEDGLIGICDICYGRIEVQYIDKVTDVELLELVSYSWYSSGAVERYRGRLSRV